jgi:hypothetical protein
MMSEKTMSEHARLKEAREGTAPWRKWGPYLSERQWGTVREDYSEDGTPWDYFPHDHARSRAYRWGEDGLAGLCDEKQRLCFALAVWNGADPILKERAFGLTNSEGNLYKYGLDLTDGTLVVVGVRQEEIVSCHATLMLFSLAIGRVSRKVCIGVLP